MWHGSAVHLSSVEPLYYYLALVYRLITILLYFALVATSLSMLPFHCLRRPGPFYRLPAICTCNRNDYVLNFCGSLLGSPHSRGLAVLPSPRGTSDGASTPRPRLRRDVNLVSSTWCPHLPFTLSLVLKYPGQASIASLPGGSSESATLFRGEEPLEYPHLSLSPASLLPPR